MSDKEDPPLMMVRRGSFLAPYTPFDSELLEGFSGGKAMRVRITNPRSVQHLRLYWALMNKISANLDNIPPKTVHGLVKLRCGYAIEVPTKTGVEKVPGSIAFDKMDDREFREFFDRAVAFICDQVIPGLRASDLKREVEEMLGVAA